MGEFIKILLSLSLSGTLFLLVIWILKHFYKNIFSRCWQYYILLLAALRFLLPVSLDYNITNYLYKIAGNIRVQEDMPVKDTDMEDAEEENGTAKVKTVKNKEVKGTDVNIITVIKQEIKNTASKVTIIYKNLFFIWMAVLIMFVTKNITVYRGFLNYIKATSEEVQDTAILEKRQYSRLCQKIL